MDDVVLELLGHLKQALRQWSMYAEMVEGSDRDFDLATEPSAEGEMYREAKRSIDRATNAIAPVGKQDALPTAERAPQQSKESHGRE